MITHTIYILQTHKMYDFLLLQLKYNYKDYNINVHNVGY